MEYILQKFSRASACTNIHQADIVLSLAKTACREEEEGSETTSKAMKALIEEAHLRGELRLVPPWKREGRSFW
jgi:hypothetical protein